MQALPYYHPLEDSLIKVAIADEESTPLNGLVDVFARFFLAFCQTWLLLIVICSRSQLSRECSYPPKISSYQPSVRRQQGRKGKAITAAAEWSC